MVTKAFLLMGVLGAKDGSDRLTWDVPMAELVVGEPSQWETVDAVEDM